MFRLLTSLLILNCALIQTSSQLVTTLPDCGGNFSGYEYSITSPNYPNNYPDNVDCTYVLRGSPLAKCNQLFNLQFLDFSLRPSEDCHGDFVEIGERSLFCGNVGGIRRYRGKDNSLRIRFRSDSGSGGVGRGFKIAVTTLPCPSNNLTVNDSLRFAEAKDDDNSIPEVEPLTDEPPTLSISPVVQPQYPVYRPPSPFTLEEEKIDQSPRIASPADLESGSTSVFTKPVKISAYFFGTPELDTSAKLSNSKVSEQSQLSQQFPPTHNIPFQSPQSYFLTSQEATTVSTRSQLSRIQDSGNTKELDKIGGISYGLPALIRYPDIKTGEVFDGTGDGECAGRPNINGGGDIYRNNYPEGVFGVEYPETIYGQPNASPGNLSPLTTQYISQNAQTPGRLTGFIPTTNPGNYFPGTREQGHCCRSLYSAPRILLSSPGFPTLLYNGNSYQCGYVIAPSSQSVCRLRLNFRFFNLGTDDPFCNNGHLEIDGRRYCGCRTGLSVISNFNQPLKGIGVRYVGFPKTKLNGFVIEVIQESCNGYPYLARSKKEVNNGTNVRVKRDLGYSYPKPNIGLEHPGHPIGHVGATAAGNKCQALSLIDWTLAAKEVYLRNARCSADSGSAQPNYPGYLPHNYPGTGNFPPNYPGGFPAGTGSYPPGGGILPPGTGSYPPGSGNLPPNYPGAGNFPPGTGNYPPGTGNFPPGTGTFPPGTGTFPPGTGNFPPGTGTFPPGTGNFPPGTGNFPPGTGSFPPGTGNFPPGTGNFPPGTDSGSTGPGSGACETVSVLEGVISTPFYPSPYPNNVNKCWRFYRAPISCRLQLSFLDFDVEPSQGCVKDSFSISGQNTRYCGRTLAGSKTLLGFPTNNVIEIYFSSDSFQNGKGFSIGFGQIPCQVEVNR